MNAAKSDGFVAVIFSALFLCYLFLLFDPLTLSVRAGVEEGILTLPFAFLYFVPVAVLFGVAASLQASSRPWGRAVHFVGLSWLVAPWAALLVLVVYQRAL